MSLKTKKWVLLVDDEEDVRQDIEKKLYQIFSTKEISVIPASNGVEAEAKLKNQTFHLIITDIRMPKKDGEELIEGVRESGFNVTTPIIAMSSYSLGDIEKKYPFVSYLDKPISKEQLEKTVKTYFKLESTQKMIEGSIFSSLIYSSIAFLKEALARDDFEIGDMALKNTGQELTADFASVIEVNVGKTNNTFSVLCDKATLEQIRDNSEKIKGQSLDSISLSLGYVILKYVLDDCNIIDSNELFTKDISQDAALLTAKRGIVVPIHALNINYKIFATTNDMGGKKNAA